MALSGGLRSLACVAAITMAATLAMVMTTACGLAWPNLAFRLVGLATIAAVVVAHAWRMSAARFVFMAGVAAAAVPSLVIASVHGLDHWDEFMTWLPNALYIWQMGGFPTAAVPPVASSLPGYPPGSSLMLAIVWSLAGRVVDDAGPVLNVLCVMILPGVLLRALGVGEQPSMLRQLGLGVILGLAATTLNVGLDWHWMLSSLPEAAVLVAFTTAFVLGAEGLFRKQVDARSSLVALALVLALIVNLKQTGIVLVGILVIALAATAWICRADDRRSVGDAAATATLVLAPSVAVWLCWHLYLGLIFPSHALSLRPLSGWTFELLPALFSAIGRTLAAHWLFSLLVAIVVARGWFVLGRSLIRGGRVSLSVGDRLAAVFALIEVAYVAFLTVCYIGALSGEETIDAAEFFRYQAEIGGAGLVTAVVLAAEWWWRPSFVRLMPAVLALQLVAVWLLSPSPGLYRASGDLSASAIESVRQLGREAGGLIARQNRTADVAMVTQDVDMAVTNDFMLAVLVMRYQMWATAPTLIRQVREIPSDDPKKALADLAEAAKQGLPAVGLVAGGARCGLYGDRDHVVLLPGSRTSERCRSLLTGSDLQTTPTADAATP